MPRGTVTTLYHHKGHRTADADSRHTRKERTRRSVFLLWVLSLRHRAKSSNWRYPATGVLTARWLQPISDVAFVKVQTLSQRFRYCGSDSDRRFRFSESTAQSVVQIAVLSRVRFSFKLVVHADVEQTFLPAFYLRNVGVSIRQLCWESSHARQALLTGCGH